MLKQCWILTLVVAGITALVPASYKTQDDHLRSALDAVTRKRRSLEGVPQDYYNDLRSFKYHGGDVERMFERERQGDRILEGEDEDLEFLPNENGQLEMVGDGFQGVNNKLLEKSVIDYLENAQEQEKVPSLFRERQRSAGNKRANDNLENSNIDGRELAKLFLEELQNDSPSYPLTDVGENYLDPPIYDRYRSNQGTNKLYENEGPMTWSELFNKGDLLLGENRNARDENNFPEKDTEQSYLYFLPTERRNVNARYPLGRELENYRTLGKRYPIAKRSPKEFQQTQRQITDPKVAQDLGALFGTQSTVENRNHTCPHEHDHNHEQNHEHEREHDHQEQEGEHAPIVNTSEAPKVTPSPKSRKENVTKTIKSKGKAIEVKKKSVDWSQYFGIDRRKKKATFLARPGTQDQDDEWMLQRYYESMAENLKPPERESENPNDDRKDNVDQIYARLNNIGMDLEKEKDQIMNRLATAYSLKKMRKALNELRNSLAAHKEAQKAANAQNNLTQNFRNTENGQRNENKRTSSSNIDTNEVSEESKICPDLEMIIDRNCQAAENLAGDTNQMFHVPCVMLQICNACTPKVMEEKCLTNYVIEVSKMCEKERDSHKNIVCLTTAKNLWELQRSIASPAQCRVSRVSTCLHLYHRYQHHYFHYPQHGG